MASKRQKGNKWEFTVKRAGLLEKPLYLTFESEAAGDEFCKNLEALLDRGIVPEQFEAPAVLVKLRHLILRYEQDAHVKQKDREVLRTVMSAKGDTGIDALTVNWVDNWVTEMKRVDKVAPATIRAKVGAVARACDWARRKGLVAMSENPFRNLPDGYAIYTDKDAAMAGGRRADIERDRRLEPGDEESIRKTIAAGRLPRKQRDRIIEDPASLLVDFDLAIETAMRMRERFTLTVDQVNLRLRTIALTKTKNGDSREVALSSVAVRILGEQLERRKGEMYLFPWFEGDYSPYALKMKSNWLSKLYADVFEIAKCRDLHEHDLRHEGVSRFFERTTLPVEAIMKIVGHRTHKMIMRYLKLRGSSLAEQLW